MITSDQADSGARRARTFPAAGVCLTPLKGLKFDVSNQYGDLYPLSDVWKLRSGAQFTDEAECDFNADYRPPWITPTPLRGLWVRARAAILDQQNAKTLGYQFRIIINWERDLF